MGTVESIGTCCVKSRLILLALLIEFNFVTAQETNFLRYYSSDRGIVRPHVNVYEGGANARS